MKLTPTQHESMRLKWKAYQLKAKEPFSHASSIPSKANSPLTVRFDCLPGGGNRFYF
jgi:hypothetical protein